MTVHPDWLALNDEPTAYVEEIQEGPVVDNDTTYLTHAGNNINVNIINNVEVPESIIVE